MMLIRGGKKRGVSLGSMGLWPGSKCETQVKDGSADGTWKLEKLSSEIYLHLNDYCSLTPK